MRRGLRIAGLSILVVDVVTAGLAFWALSAKMPVEPSLPGKLERGSLEHGGRARTWLAYVPARLQPHPGIVLALHGSMRSPARARQAYGYDFDLLAAANEIREFFQQAQ